MKITFPAKNPALVAFHTLKNGDTFLTQNGSVGIRVNYNGDNMDAYAITAVVISQGGVTMLVEYDAADMVEPCEVSIAVSHVSPEKNSLDARERECVALGNKLEAVKHYRDRVECGLREAKDAVWAYADSLGG